LRTQWVLHLDSDERLTPELLEWLHTFRKPPSQTYLVHGEPTARPL
jgi:hypothetical protein